MNKVMVRNVTENIVPDHIRLRIAKTGFNMPFDVWIYDERLRTKMMDVFNSQKFRDRGVFNPQSVDIMVKAHFSKEKNYGMQLWQILNLELWFCKWIDS
jgi:asparagine synthase (glutamine-hydrolysing)